MRGVYNGSSTKVSQTGEGIKQLMLFSVCLQVTHAEPWEKGSRKTAGQTGMCGGVSEKYVLFIFPISPHLYFPYLPG